MSCGVTAGRAAGRALAKRRTARAIGPDRAIGPGAQGQTWATLVGLAAASVVA